MATSLPVQMALKQNGSLLPGVISVGPNLVGNHSGGPVPGPPPPPIGQPAANPPGAGGPTSQDSVANILSETTAATWLAIGSLAESLGDFDKALASYDGALRHSPNNPDALTKLANIYRFKDVFFKAAELYEQALNFNPENGETWGLLGHCYLMLDDLQRAYAAYQRALYYLDNPNVPKLWHGIGILYDRYGSLEYAEEAFVRVLELDPNFDKSNEIYFRLGIIYKHQGKLQSALECFQYILSNPPHPLTQPDVWFQIGSVLEQQKDWNGAKDAYEKVLQVNPQHAKVLQQLGCLYSQADSSANNNGNNTSNNSSNFQQDLNIALNYLSQSLEIDQSDAHSWYYLGRVHMIRGDFNAAYEAFQQAVNRDSRNPTFWCSIGVLYYQISQYRDALDAYTRAIRLNPYISEVWYDLGTLYETCNNQISDALDAYRQAERLDPGNPHIKARLDQLIKYQEEGNTHPPQPPPVNQQPRLPQGMVLESTQQQPGGQPGVNGSANGGPPGPPGPPGLPHNGSNPGHDLQQHLHQPPPPPIGQSQQPPPQLGQSQANHLPSHQPQGSLLHQASPNPNHQPPPQLRQVPPPPTSNTNQAPQSVPVHYSQQPTQPQLQSIQQPPQQQTLVPPLNQPSIPPIRKPELPPTQLQPSATQSPVPVVNGNGNVNEVNGTEVNGNGKHDLENKTDESKLLKKQTPSSPRAPVPVANHDNAAPVPAPVPTPVTDAPPQPVAEPTSDSTAITTAPRTSSASPIEKPQSTKSEPNPVTTKIGGSEEKTAEKPASVPNIAEAESKSAVPQFSSNVTGDQKEETKEAEDEEVAESKRETEPVEPPMRRIDEDENYDDE